MRPKSTKPQAHNFTWKQRRPAAQRALLLGERAASDLKRLCLPGVSKTEWQKPRLSKQRTVNGPPRPLMPDFSFKGPTISPVSRVSRLTFPVGCEDTLCLVLVLKPRGGGVSPRVTAVPAHPLPAPTQGWEETDGASMSGRRSSCSQREINVTTDRCVLRLPFH